MSLPIRARLSLSYFLIFAVAGSLLAGASWGLARHSLLAALDHEMDEHIDDLHDFVVANGLVTDEARASSSIADEFGLKDEGKWLQIEDAQGHWIYRSRHMLVAPHTIPPAASLPAKGSFLNFHSDDDDVRSLRRAFSIGGHVWVVEMGTELQKTNHVLADFRDDLLLIAPIVLLIAGFAGHLLSRRALDPVAAIATEAQRIHEGNLQSRLPSLDTGDELAHLSSTLNHMLERVESSVRSVRDFTAHASHELRTPVALIRSESELALRFDRSPREYREALSIIAAEATQMSSLLDSLLSLTRADAGTEQTSMECVDAQQLCSVAYQKWRPFFSAAGIHLRADIPAAPLQVIADHFYLPRLLNVILENALKYTPAGGSVCLALSAHDVLARFEVSDTGIGIPEEDRSRIFDRFFRAGNVREANASGSGLGLALAAWIADRHRTKIEVSSGHGDGSSFSWTLPAVPQAGPPLTVDADQVQHNSIRIATVA